jgi:hypothetical protein
VTLESGVRVFRPLPPHSKVIINPDGRTPLSLSFEENRTHNYHHEKPSSNGQTATAADSSGDHGHNGYGYIPDTGRRQDVQGRGYIRPQDRLPGPVQPRRIDHQPHHPPVHHPKHGTPRLRLRP